MDSDGRAMGTAGQRQRAPKAKDREKFERAVEVIVCNLVALALSAAGPEARLSNAGHRSIAIIKANHASSTSPVYGKPFNRTVTLMEEAGLVTVEIGYRYDRWSRAASTITATPDMRLPVVSGWNALELVDHDHLIALNTDGGPPSRIPPGLKRDVIAINAHLCTAKIESGAVLHVTSWTSTIIDRLVTPRHRQLHRVFNGDYASGGRLYGGWWQTLPRNLRKHIRIDNEPVVNVDFATMHLGLAYAQEGRQPPRGDLYDLTGTDHERHDWPTEAERRPQAIGGHTAHAQATTVSVARRNATREGGYQVMLSEGHEGQG